MIATNSLAAFTAEISRATGPMPVRAATPAPGPAAPDSTRRLEALPPPPAAPLPRGSLLDLRI